MDTQDGYGLFKGEIMSLRFLMSVLRWLLSMLLALSAGAALAQSEPQKLVNAADTTFLNFCAIPK